MSLSQETRGRRMSALATTLQRQRTTSSMEIEDYDPPYVLERWTGVLIQTDVKGSTKMWKADSADMAKQLRFHDRIWRKVLNEARRLDNGTHVEKINQIGDMWQVGVSGHYACSVSIWMAQTLQQHMKRLLEQLPIRVGMMWSPDVILFKVKTLSNYPLKCIAVEQVENYLKYLESNHHATQISTIAHVSNTFWANAKKENESKDHEMNVDVEVEPESCEDKPCEGDTQRVINKSMSVFGEWYRDSNWPELRMPTSEIEKKKVMVCFIWCQHERNEFLSKLSTWMGDDYKRPHSLPEFRSNNPWRVLSVENNEHLWNMVCDEEESATLTTTTAYSWLRRLFASADRKALHVTLVRAATLYQLIDCASCYDVESYQPKSDGMGSEQVFERWVGQGQNVGARMLEVNAGICKKTALGMMSVTTEDIGDQDSMSPYYDMAEIVWKSVDMRVSEEKEKRWVGSISLDKCAAV